MVPGTGITINGSIVVRTRVYIMYNDLLVVSFCDLGTTAPRLLLIPDKTAVRTTAVAVEWFYHDIKNNNICCAAEKLKIYLVKKKEANRTVVRLSHIEQEHQHKKSQPKTDEMFPPITRRKQKNNSKETSTNSPGVSDEAKEKTNLRRSDSRSGDSITVKRTWARGVRCILAVG